MRVWDTSQQAKCSGGSRTFYENGYPFSMLATKLFFIRLRKDGKGMERKRETEHNDLLPKKVQPSE